MRLFQAEIAALKNQLNDLQTMNRRLQTEMETVSTGDSLVNFESQIAEIIQWLVSLYAIAIASDVVDINDAFRL